MAQAPEPDLNEVRRSIDRVDEDIVRLLATREQFVRLAGQLKSDAQAVRAPARVDQVVARVRAAADKVG
jgi:isochorismate pyruvate lyase